MNNTIKTKLAEIVGEERVFQNEPMKLHTTFRIGGPADFLVIPETGLEVKKLIRTLKELDQPYFVMGNGSNLLVSDRGYRGTVIQLLKSMSKINVEGNRVTAEAGALLSQTAQAARNKSLTGLEFAAGIPGTVGGACVMNAGAYGGEMKQVLVSVTALNEDNEIVDLGPGELELGYRTSVFMKRNMTVLSAVMELNPGDQAKITEIMNNLKEQRKSKQPLELPSAGSTFKRPEGYFAGKLIMDTGLRGFRVGGAQVSEKHCGFVVNTGDASADDVLSLIREVQRQVFDKYGVELKTEVKFLGEF